VPTAEVPTPTRGAAATELLFAAEGLVDECDAELRRALPADVAIVDAHVHVGQDVDGMVGDREELVAMLDAYGAAHAFAFCLDEPDRGASFSAPNDRTLGQAERSGGRLIPFVRLALDGDPIVEAVRCLDRGARGIKLHPRAQSFALDDDRLEPVFALAAERTVPILIHGGHGLPPIADALLRLVEAYPGAQLIVAHAGVADMGRLARALAGRPGVYFDTSTWSALDLVDLFARVPPEQVLYASDYPYGQQPSALTVAVRAATCAGLGEPELGTVLGGAAARIAAGEPPLRPTLPRAPAGIAQPLPYARIHQYLSMAAPLLWTRRRDSVGVLDLAVAVCEGEPDDPALARIGAMLATASGLWRSLADAGSPAAMRTIARATIQLIQLADALAATTRTELCEVTT
jgi:predicted TIM-barrel fold metal-dependent hydrolase